ncbi:MAG: hypothetical protein CL916_06070 [Deltaproteobacteria bacterium]|nr:hypothetical protein [Deltaproteobacteria bacterium]
MLFTILSSFFACSTEKLSEDVIRLSWEDGQEFHIASSRRMLANKTEESAVSLELSGTESTFDDMWTSEVVWSYRVVETAVIPDVGDELYPYSIGSNGDQVPLSVIKVTLDETLNGDEALLGLDPVTYLIFTSSRNRLAGVIQFSNLDGERVEKAYSSKELSQDWSVLSQSNLSMIPTYLAPYGSKWEGSDRMLSNGSFAVAEKQNDVITDVVFEDLMGGEVVATRYEAGMPWPTWTVSANLNARMLSAEELLEIRGNVPAMLPQAPENFDYRAALSRSINLDSAQAIAQEDITTGELEFVVHEGYRPWAGNWWPLKTGKLVFGYLEGKETISGLIREDADEIKLVMDELSTEIRELRKSEEDKEEEIKAKQEEFSTKQKELVDLLVDFYNNLLRDLDGGVIRIEDGELRKDAQGEEGEEGAQEGWSFPINSLSPMDKFAVSEYLSGNTHPNPFYVSAWEILNSYNPGGADWWGHCNGWAAASILTHEPREERTITAGDTDITFSTADLKGLLTESHYSTQSIFYGERYNGEEDDIADLTPAHFHKLITFYLKEQGVPFVFDTTASEAVWNFPVWEAFVTMETASEINNGTLNVNTATMEELAAVLDEFDTRTAWEIVTHRDEEGGFQEMDDLLFVDTYDPETMASLLRIDVHTKTLNVTTDLRFTTDGVDEEHIDEDIDAPEFFVKQVKYTLELDEKGNIIGGTWEDENEHPDFAWVPYLNPRKRSKRGSENPYLVYDNMLDAFGKEMDRH